MSRPKYSNSDVSVNSVIVKIEELLIYIFTITNNSKQFPKACRYTLVSDIRNTVINLYKIAYKAVEFKPRHKKEMKLKIQYINEMYDELHNLKALIYASIRVCNVSNPKHLSDMYDIVVSAFIKWRSNVHRAYANLPSEKKYNKDRKKAKKRAADRKKFLDEATRDSDGFIVLEYSETEV